MVLICAAWTRIFARPRVEGRQHLKRLEGPVILAVNHLSIFDIPALAGLISRYRRDVTFLAKAELFANVVARVILNWFGIIPSIAAPSVPPRHRTAA
ncbi:MAG TPA: 1-acyl-sn-glycerol-3-phosphate acyltransferase [Candidatus Saccharimonadales bacterium]|nr:1-acyl-sn-glycerol-3-phosphate acyltransferase [Candidatus Saccharimonadales bacterium]